MSIISKKTESAPLQILFLLYFINCDKNIFDFSCDLPSYPKIFRPIFNFLQKINVLFTHSGKKYDILITIFIKHHKA